MPFDGTGYLARVRVAAYPNRLKGLAIPGSISWVSLQILWPLTLLASSYPPPSIGAGAERQASSFS